MASLLDYSLTEPELALVGGPHPARAPEIRPHLRAAIGLLAQAYEYAAELGQDVWDFAVELDVLRAATVSNSDLRWLLSMGYLEHAHETTRPEDQNRQFQCMPPALFAPRSCFVFTATGAATAGTSCCPLSTEAKAPTTAMPRRQQPAEDLLLLPIWDHDRRQVRWGTNVVKEFKVPAPNQETILAAFQEEGWPPRIDDPLRPMADVDPRRRLHDTIKALNGKQKHDVLRFMGDGNGEGVRWELRTSRISSAVDNRGRASSAEAD